MHSWYQMMMGTNESLYGWMDEGFASFADSEVDNYYTLMTNPKFKQNASDSSLRLEGSTIQPLPAKHSGAYSNYFALVKFKLEEPLTTHADHYNTNLGYGISSYSKGEIFLVQLGYIVGEEVRDKILLEYYNRWRFKHPDVNDFIKVAEDVSNMKLDWYKEYWINTTKTIDYGIDSLWEENGVSKIRLKRVGLMPMPVDVELKFKDGSREMHYVPLNLMFGTKSKEGNLPVTIHEEWRWTHPTHVIEFNRKLTDLKQVEIDPSQRMADIERKNNLLQLNW